MHFLLVVASLFVFWLLMSGFWVPFLLTAGLASAVLVAAFAHRMGAIDREGQPFHLSWRALTYWPWLIWEIAKAAWDLHKAVVDADEVRVSQAGFRQP